MASQLDNPTQLFKPGKLTFIMDGQFGSSGKGKLASYVGEKYKHQFQFACNAFSAQAGHWVKLQDGRCHFYQHLNSIAYNSSLYEKMYIGPASCIELPALLREIEENNMTPENLGISPLATLITTHDMEFERGLRPFDFSGPRDQIAPRDRHSGTSATGSTAHGVGSCMARKVLRRSSVVCMKDIPELKPFLCDVSTEIMMRLASGQAGLCEIAQGFPLSLNHHFYPHSTSRNVTVAQALSDMMIAPVYAGPVILNFRTFPIRINSNKFIGEDGRHLTWQEVNDGVPHTVFEGNSGHWYPDQHEISWQDLTRMSGSDKPIMEITSVTKLPRRVATFSKNNLREAALFNNTGEGIVISINFANYVDASMTGKRSLSDITDTFQSWLSENLNLDDCLYPYTSLLRFIGTGPYTEDTIELVA